MTYISNFVCDFWVYSTDISNTVNSYSQFSPVLTANQAGNLHAAWNVVYPGSAFNFNCNLYGAVNRVALSAAQTGTVTKTVGSTNDVYNYGTGTIGSAFGSYNVTSNASTGIITNGYGSYSQVDNSGGGSITNGYGVYVAAVQATNKWSVYATDATAPSYFASRVGIGATAPITAEGAKLFVDNGNVAFESASPSLIFYETDQPVDNKEWHLIVNNAELYLQASRDVAGFGGGNLFKFTRAVEQIQTFQGLNSGIPWFSIDNNIQRVGIGTTLPGGQLELSLDQGRKPATNTWTIVSDERLKNIEGAYTKGLNEILQLQPITYHYKNAGERTFKEETLNTLNVGFSAQDVQKIFPEAVGTDADGYLNFNMHSILVAYANAIKEQQKMIENLKAVIGDQSSVISKLQTSNEMLKADYDVRLNKLEDMLGTKAKKK